MGQALGQGVVLLGAFAGRPYSAIPSADNFCGAFIPSAHTTRNAESKSGHENALLIIRKALFPSCLSQLFHAVKIRSIEILIAITVTRRFYVHARPRSQFL